MGLPDWLVLTLKRQSMVTRQRHQLKQEKENPEFCKTENNVEDEAYEIRNVFELLITFTFLKVNFTS